MRPRAMERVLQRRYVDPPSVTVFLPTYVVLQQFILTVRCKYRIYKVDANAAPSFDKGRQTSWLSFDQ